MEIKNIHIVTTKRKNYIRVSESEWLRLGVYTGTTYPVTDLDVLKKLNEKFYESILKKDVDAPTFTSWLSEQGFSIRADKFKLNGAELSKSEMLMLYHRSLIKNI